MGAGKKMKESPKLVVLMKRVIISEDQDPFAPRQTAEDYQGKLDQLTHLEQAALKIQRTARQKLPGMAMASDISQRRARFAEKDPLWDIDEEESNAENVVNVHEKEEEEDGSRWFTLIFLAISSCIMGLYSYFSCCIEMCLGSADFRDQAEDPYLLEPTEFTEASATQANGQSGQVVAQQAAANAKGGTGTPGAETAAAQTAVSTIASGMTTAIAAGTVTLGTTGGIVGGTLAAMSTSAKVVTAVVVTAAVYSTYQGVEQLTSELVPIVPYTSQCGIENPDSRSGDFTLYFEGLARGVMDREISLLEGLVVSAYNNLTFGNDFNTATQTYNCVDEYLREMKESKLMDQNFTEPLGNQTSVLEINLEATILCQNCPAVLPIFGTILDEDQDAIIANNDLAPSVERYLRRMSQVQEFFDISFIEVFLRSIVESLFELMNEGELPLNLAPSKIYFRGLSNQTDGSEDAIVEGGAVEVNIPIGIYDDKINSAIVPVFPTASTNQNDGIDFYEGNFNMSLTGVSLSRPFTPEESVMLENLFVQAYNEVTGGSDSSQLREMARSSLVGQNLITGEDGQPTLQLTFKGFVTCEGCPPDQSLFGDINGSGLDLELIQRVLQKVIVDVVDAIEDEELPAEFLPAALSVADESTNEDLVNVPIFTETYPNGTIEIIDIPNVGFAPQTFEDEFFISFRGFDRMFNEEEAQIVQTLLLEAYNNHARGNVDDEGGSTTTDGESYNRMMTDVVLKEQIFTEADSETGELSTLDMTLDVSVLCDDCPEGQPVFGVERDGVEGGLLDWTFIEGVMINVIFSLMQNIQDEVLSDGFVPEEVTTHTDETNDFFVSIPLNTYFDPETGTYVIELLPTIVEFPSNAPSLSASEAPSVTTSNLPSSRPITSMVPSAEPSAKEPGFPTVMPSLNDQPTQPPTRRTSKLPSPPPSLPPSDSPSSAPSEEPRSLPSLRPSARPSIIFSGQPTPAPSFRPSKSPSIMPTDTPSKSPSRSPSASPSSRPSKSPTPVPTSRPSNRPTATLPVPSKMPTPAPTSGPTLEPTSTPVAAPTTSAPALSPTSGPMSAPTPVPTRISTPVPTPGPTSGPTSRPIGLPSVFPSSAPTPISRFWVTCGTYLTNANKCAGIVPQFVDPTNTTVNGVETALRCCADSKVSNNWRQPNDNLWSNDGDPTTNCPWASSPGSCNRAINYTSAKHLCEVDYGGRLCTRAELEAGCATLTGCNFDTYPVWSSDSDA